MIESTTFNAEKDQQARDAVYDEAVSGYHSVPDPKPATIPRVARQIAFKSGPDSGSLQVCRSFQGPLASVKAILYRSVVVETASDVVQAHHHKRFIQAVLAVLGLYLAFLNLYIFSYGTQSDVGASTVEIICAL